MGTVNSVGVSKCHRQGYMDQAGNEAVRHKEHQSDGLTELLVSVCRAGSDPGQKQHYGAGRPVQEEEQ